MRIQLKFIFNFSYSFWQFISSPIMIDEVSALRRTTGEVGGGGCEGCYIKDNEWAQFLQYVSV